MTRTIDFRAECGRWSCLKAICLEQSQITHALSFVSPHRYNALPSSQPHALSASPDIHHLCEYSDLRGSSGCRTLSRPAACGSIADTTRATCTMHGFACLMHINLILTRVKSTAKLLLLLDVRLARCLTPCLASDAS